MVAVLASVTAGCVLGVTLGRQTAPALQPAEASPQGDDLAAAMRGLTEELARLRASQEQLTAPPSGLPSRTEIAGARGDVDAQEIREATEQLTAAIELMRTSVGAARSDRAPLVAPSVAPDRSALDTVPPNNASAGKTYQLMTCQQLMDRFGAPDFVGVTDGNPVWNYRASTGIRVAFTFADGRVAYVQATEPIR